MSEGDPEVVVSIIMPVHNGAATVERAVRSIQSDSFSKWELLVVDDHSQDETAKIVESLAEQDARIRCLSNVGKGVSAARNLGIEEARGDLIGFLDADDMYQGNSIEKRVQYLAEHSKCQAVHCSTEVCDENLNCLWRFGAEPIVTFSHMYGMPFHINSLVMRSGLAKKLRFSESFTNGEDWLFVSQMARSGVECCLVEDASVAYVQHKNSAVQRDIVEHERQVQQVINILYGEDHDCNSVDRRYKGGLRVPEKQHILAERRFGLVLWLLLSGDTGGAEKTIEGLDMMKEWRHVVPSRAAEIARVTVMRHFACPESSWLPHWHQHESACRRFFDMHMEAPLVEGVFSQIGELGQQIDMIDEKCELLSLDIFETHAKEMAIVDAVGGYLNQKVGWHYCLDLAWMLREISSVPVGGIILDAGGGSGLAQFILSELGYNVINVDFSNATLSKRARARYKKQLSYLDDHAGVVSDNRYTRFLQRVYSVPGRADRRQASAMKATELQALRSGSGRQAGPKPEGWVTRTMRRIPFRADNEILAASDGSKTPHRRGRIIQYRSDIMNMQMLPDGFVDATISISALEHNDDEGVENCVKEMLRVTRPGGILAVTVSASVAEDWFHEPSKGWCYSEGTLKKLFGLPASASSNFSHREALLAAFRKEDNELHRRLASFYYQSGDNGMPWGKWDPQYLPVGVVREKGR